MKISVTERKPGVKVVTPSGEVDMSTSPDLRKILVPLFSSGASHIVVDLSAVSYMDSSGIATLVEGLQLSRRKGNVRYSLAGAVPSVEAVFELACLKSVFEMVPRIEQLFEGDDRA